MLPNESMLQVLHFADYKTLVLAKRAGRRFLHVGIKFADDLARQHSFRVTFYTTSIEFNDVTIGAEERIRYEAGNRESLAAACRELAEAIGPHAVAELNFCGTTWNMPDVDVVFGAAPPLKYAEEVEMYGYNGVEKDPAALMHNLDGTKALSMWLDYDGFRQFNWSFLRQESARELRRVKFTIRSAWSEAVFILN